MTYDDKNTIGRRVLTPSGRGIIIDALWDAKDRLELRVRLDADPDWETGLHVYLARICTIGRPSRSDIACDARAMVDL